MFWLTRHLQKMKLSAMVLLTKAALAVRPIVIEGTDFINSLQPETDSKSLVLHTNQEAHQDTTHEMASTLSLMAPNVYETQQ